MKVIIWTETTLTMHKLKERNDFMGNNVNLSEEEIKNWEVAIYERTETSSTQAMQALLQLHKERSLEEFLLLHRNALVCLQSILRILR